MSANLVDCISRKDFIGAAVAGLLGVACPSVAFAMSDNASSDDRAVYGLISKKYYDYTLSQSGKWTVFSEQEDGSVGAIASYDTLEECLDSQQRRSVGGELLKLLFKVGKYIVEEIIVRVVSGIIIEVISYVSGGSVGSDIASVLINKKYNPIFQFDCDFYPPHSFQWVKCVNG